MVNFLILAWSVTKHIAFLIHKISKLPNFQSILFSVYYVGCYPVHNFQIHHHLQEIFSEQKIENSWIKSERVEGGGGWGSGRPWNTKRTFNSDENCWKQITCPIYTRTFVLVDIKPQLDCISAHILHFKSHWRHNRIRFCRFKNLNLSITLWIDYLLIYSKIVIIDAWNCLIMSFTELI